MAPDMHREDGVSSERMMSQSQDCLSLREHRANSRRHQKELFLQASHFQTSSLQNGEAIHVPSLRHLATTVLGCELKG